jgi:hypothetical protein
MEQVIMVELIPCLFEAVEKRENPRSALWGFKRRLRGFREVPGAISAESAERYRRSTYQRGSRGVATRATGKSSGTVVGKHLHRYVQT